MADLRYRIALRAFLGDPSEQNALAAFAAAIRAGVIDIGSEPATSMFGDWGISYVHKSVYRNLSEEGKNWVNENDVDLMGGHLVIDVHQEIDGEDVVEPPQDLADIMDAADNEGYNYIAFE